MPHLEAIWVQPRREGAAAGEAEGCRAVRRHRWHSVIICNVALSIGMPKRKANSTPRSAQPPPRGRHICACIQGLYIGAGVFMRIHRARARARTNTYAYVASECYVWGIPVASASETGHHPRVSICMLIPNRPSSSTSPPRGAGRASRSAERVFFSTSWRMPSANAEDPCRSEGTQRRVYPGLFQRCPLIRSSPRRSPLVCPEKLSKVDPRSGPIFEALASEFPNVRSSALYLEAL